MKMEVHIENPIVNDLDQFKELERRVQETDPTIYSLRVMKNMVIIERLGKRRFRYNATPSMDWIITKVQYMRDHDI